MPDPPGRKKNEDDVQNVLKLFFNDAQVNWARFPPTLAAALVGPLAESFSDGYDFMANDESAIEPDEPRTNASAEQWAKNRSQQLVSELTTTSRRMLDGGSEPEVVFGDERAEKISITEVTTAITAGEALVLAILVSQGEPEQTPIWVTEKDGLVCPICRPLHGKTKDVFGRVNPAGPPAHPRCRCFLRYETKR